MPYELEITNDAERDIKSLDKTAAQRIYARLRYVAASADPFNHVKRLSGAPLFSLRAGDYRAILDIKRDKLIILVVKVGHRRDVYKTD